MNIAAIVNFHNDVECLLDTLDSILTYMTKDVIVLIDGVHWETFKDLSIPVGKLKGFPHGKPKSPYRNVALGIKTLIDTYPTADWYCYCEYDVLFGSDRFKRNLKMAEEAGVWMLGNDGRVDEMAMPIIQALIGEAFKGSYYLLGCCQFFSKKFIERLEDINFFDKFLSLTNAFTDGYFPFYSGYDLSEHLYPTLCRHFGGNIGVFAHYDEYGKWHGSYEYFPVRWKPQLDSETENFPEASILHPLKDFAHPIRIYHREKRQQWKDLQNQENQLDLSSTYPCGTIKAEEGLSIL